MYSFHFIVRLINNQTLPLLR